MRKWTIAVLLGVAAGTVNVLIYEKFDQFFVLLGNRYSLVLDLCNPVPVT